MKQEKIKEILSQDKYNNLRGVRLVEKVLQEYGQWVRQQTLEEAIESVPEESSYKVFQGEERIGEYTLRFSNMNPVLRNSDIARTGFDICRQQTLSNLQKLKDN